METFRLDRMTGDIRKLTAVSLGVVAVLIFLSRSGPPDARQPMELAASVALGICALTWLAFRPTRFIVDQAGLRIEWPIRVRAIARSAIVGARVVKASEFRQAHGLKVRIGAGGLFGTFGLLKGSRETFSVWVSRSDRWVVVQLKDGARPLLLTPAHPEKFVRALGTLPSDGVSASRN